MGKLLEGDELEKRCRAIGVDIQGPPRTQSASGNAPRASDYELQQRLREVERSIREHRLWVIALISAIASVLSAVTAVVAVHMAK